MGVAAELMIFLWQSNSALHNTALKWCTLVLTQGSSTGICIKKKVCTPTFDAPLVHVCCCRGKDFSEHQLSYLWHRPSCDSQRPSWVFLLLYTSNSQTLLINLNMWLMPQGQTFFSGHWYHSLWDTTLIVTHKGPPRKIHTNRNPSLVINLDVVAAGSKILLWALVLFPLEHCPYRDPKRVWRRRWAQGGADPAGCQQGVPCFRLRQRLLWTRLWQCPIPECHSQVCLPRPLSCLYLSLFVAALHKPVNMALK